MFMDPVEFYKKNKDCSWSMPSPPNHCQSNYDIAYWLLNESNFGWLKLDLEIDIDFWKAEYENCKGSLVPHREDDNNNGWNSTCIHGIDTHCTGAWTNYGYTNETDVPYKWTSISNSAQTIKTFWQEQFPADNYRRVRFMELESLSSITPHSDMPGRLPGEENFNALEFGVPVNISVIQPSNCFMTLENYGVVPFKEGEAYIVNIRHYHSVLNMSDTPRIHVIGHPFGYGSKKEQFVDLVARSYFKSI